EEERDARRGLGSATAERVGSRACIRLYLLPQRPDVAPDVLERRVEGLPNAVETASERQALLVMVEDREDRRDGIALPDDVDRVDLVGEPPVDHPVGDRDPTVLAHEPAVCVQDDVALMRGGRVPT